MKEPEAEVPPPPSHTQSLRFLQPPPPTLLTAPRSRGLHSVRGVGLTRTQ